MGCQQSVVRRLQPAHAQAMDKREPLRDVPVENQSAMACPLRIGALSAKEADSAWSVPLPCLLTSHLCPAAAEECNLTPHTDEKLGGIGFGDYVVARPAGAEACDLAPKSDEIPTGAGETANFTNERTRTQHPAVSKLLSRRRFAHRHSVPLLIETTKIDKEDLEEPIDPKLVIIMGSPWEAIDEAVEEVKRKPRRRSDSAFHAQHLHALETTGKPRRASLTDLDIQKQLLENQSLNVPLFCESSHLV